ncbi:MAG TPA: hypothetical protein VFF55_07665, partial [Candidatus Deferrimicrobium sp.]|nr:hypothetical protein [Candidatus Deferrimicrobium sp.]
MRHRVIAAIVLLSLIASPAAVHAQEEPTPGILGALERSLLEQLCSVDVAVDADLPTCLLTVAAALSGGASLMVPEAAQSAQPQDLLEQTRQAVDEALASAQLSVEQFDLRAAVDEAVASARDVDLRAALDEAVAVAGAADLQARIDEAVAAASDADVEAALAEAVAAAQAIDLQAALDEALALLGEAVPATGEVDVDTFLAGGVQTTREVIAVAQTWANDNADAICAGSGLSVGVAAAGVVAYLTGSPGLAITAFEKTERLSSDVCGE